MVTGLNPSNEQFVTSLDVLQSNLANTQQQLSTGLRVNQASDAPQEVQDIFQARADVANSSQIVQNLNTVKAQVDTADSSIQTAIQLLQNAAVLGAQGAPSATTQSQRNALASQVQSVLSQLVGIANTQVSGVYIFGGDAPLSQPYQLDSASPTGVDRLVNVPDTQQIQDATGVTFQISMTAQQLFDVRDVTDNPTPQNAFAAVNSLVVALEAGDTNGINQAIQSIQTSSTYINQQLGFYGAAQNRIASSLDLAQKFQVQDQAHLSDLQDTNAPAAAVQLTQETTALNAAMAAEAKRPTSTLFDFLPLTTG
jgi:flagellar hook-associated protein 3 FlgL